MRLSKQPAPSGAAFYDEANIRQKNLPTKKRFVKKDLFIKLNSCIFAS